MIKIDPCTDAAMISLATRGAVGLVREGATTATVLLTSGCPVQEHGTHVTTAVINDSGKMRPNETRALCRRLRSLADELEARFAPEGGSN